MTIHRRLARRPPSTKLNLDLVGSAINLSMMSTWDANMVVRTYTINEYARAAAPRYARVNRVSRRTATRVLTSFIRSYLETLRNGEVQNGPFGLGGRIRKISSDSFEIRYTERISTRTLDRAI